MTTPSLRADCARCAALCCVAFAFDKSDAFGADKAAGEPCAHLTACGHCAIHPFRAQQGYAGCVGYDCLGAGQWVTQALFGGRSWRDEPALLRPMAEAFLTVQRAHALLQLLGEARRLPLTARERRRLVGFKAAIEAERASPAAVAALGREVHGLLRRLGQRLRPASGTE